MYKKLFWLLLIAMCCINEVSATYGIYQGCYSSSSGSGYIYYESSGTYSGYPNYKSNSQDGDKILKSNTYCSVVTNADCRVGGGSGSGFWGKITTFYFYNCPIDDYILLVLTLIGGFGVFSLRKAANLNLS